ncbi:JNK-interacting protein 3 [Taenia solium]|eukprot:TsM_000334400 transcript=TsM_000334400 gene=TsM_000334400
MESVTDSSSNYLSPHVRNIASLVCSEFERLVSRYGEGVVDGIVPIMIQTLERVDQLHEANELLQVSCAQDEMRAQSLTLRLDREIKARRTAEERVIALEDEIAELTMRTNEKLANFNRLVRVLEAKCTAANEHVTRQEAKEAELRRDLASAQNRCNELLRSHVAHVERARNHMHPLLTERASLSEFHGFISKESIDRLDPISPTKDVAQLSTLPSPDNHNIDDPVFDALDETTDYEHYLGEQPPIRIVSEASDTISEGKQLLLCHQSFLALMLSLEAEVKKLLAENQELTEMKQVLCSFSQALNVLKDDLLTRIDDLSCESMVLKNDLKTCQKELAANHERARKRERQLVQRIQHLTSQLRAMEKLHEGRSRSALVRCVSLDLSNEPLTVQTSRRRRTHSCSAALPTINSSKPQQQQGSDFKRAQPKRVGSVSSGSSSGTLRLTKREIARILVERNYYKEHYLEIKSRLCAIEDAYCAQHPFAHMRKREIASVLVSRIFQSMHHFASDVAQGFDGLIAPIEDPTPPPPPSRTSTALWNILGNFVGQAVTYTADAVIGTGNDLPLDASRPVIAANINSRLPIAPPQPKNQPPL